MAIDTTKKRPLGISRLRRGRPYYGKNVRVMERTLMRSKIEWKKAVENLFWKCGVRTSLKIIMIIKRLLFFNFIYDNKKNKDNICENQLFKIYNIYICYIKS